MATRLVDPFAVAARVRRLQKPIWGLPPSETRRESGRRHASRLELGPVDFADDEGCWLSDESVIGVSQSARGVSQDEIPIHRTELGDSRLLLAVC